MTIGFGGVSEAVWAACEGGACARLVGFAVDRDGLGRGTLPRGSGR